MVGQNHGEHLAFRAVLKVDYLKLVYLVHVDYIGWKLWVVDYLNLDSFGGI